MTARHTPGPWWIVPAFDKRRGDGAFIQAGDVIVAEAWMDCESGDEEARVATVADARLIAAAPELAEALEDCDRAFAGWQVGGIPGRPEDILALVSKARAALRKAGVLP